MTGAADTTTRPEEIEAAARLWAAAEGREPCPPVRDLIGDSDIGSAYRVARIGHDKRMAAGARQVGWKIGITSEAVMRQIGVDQPDFGVLYADMAVADGGHVPAGRLLQPRVEAEVAFVLAADLDGATDVDTVRKAIGHAVPALEIVDSRVADWNIRITDTVADNASCGMYVLGTEARTLDEIDLIGLEMAMDHDGETVSTGTGAACLGDPVAAAAWLATATASYGEPLRAGDLILSGALGPMVPVRPGTVTARLSGFGSVTVTFDPHLDPPGDGA